MSSPVQGSVRALCTACGPRAVEALLQASVQSHLEELARDPRRLGAPLRIVVPSRSLQLHVSRALTRSRGALAGVSVQTLFQLANEVVERAGAEVAQSDIGLLVVVRQLARAEPALRERLEELVGGYGIVEATVSDLLDAGFEPWHAEPVAEAVLESTRAGPLRERALAVVRVAAGVAQSVAAGEIGHRTRLFRSACECIEGDPEAALPSAGVFVHGYADATGVQADLLEALVRHRGAAVGLDLPADPAEPGALDAGVVFGERFAERMAAAARVQPERPEPGPPAEVEVLHAPGVHAEVRAVAERVRACLESGVEPEDVAVVARQLAPYRVAIRLHFGRLGIPFSAVGVPGPPGPARRQLEALLALLERRERAPAERWIDALESLPGGLSPGRRADLLLAFHTLGAARLGEVAGLAAAEDVALPVRLGLADPEGPRRRAPRKRVERETLAAAVAAAAGLCRRLAAWPERAPLAAHLARLRELVERDLRWRPGTAPTEALESELFAPGAPEALVLDGDDLALYVGRALSGAGFCELGGRGAGVQVLDVTEARARSAEHLFLVGMSRDAFPRAVSEDPLLPDALRRSLRAALPDLPVKSEGHDEERYLFAQLLASAPRVTLSAPVSDEDGRARAVSPLVERMRFASHVPEPVRAPALHAARAVETGALRPAHEHALLAGLYGTRAGFGRVLEIALAETAAKPDPRLARGRAAVLAEIDPTRRRARGLGPYFGFVGAPGARDPRRADVYVTALEAVARCPWQGFLQRVLRVEALPDPHGELPSADARLVGQLVHRVLERIVGDALEAPGGPLDAAVARAPAAAPWPDPPELEALVREAAASLVREAGIGLPGFARVLALRAGAYLARARALDWPDGGAVGALGVEVEGRVELPGRRPVWFKADRVDRVGEALRLVDYKTGRPREREKKDATRREKFRQRIARAELLQAGAYALAAAASSGAAAEGRYVYLHPEDDLPQLVFEVASDDAEAVDAFTSAAATGLDAWEAGTFVPRLVEPGKDEDRFRCERCEVKEACLRGDSGARRRLAEWASARADADADDATPQERTLLAVWSLPEAT